MHPTRTGDGILSPQELQKIQIGKTTSAELSEIAGKPMRLERFPRKGVEYWTYLMQAQEIGNEIDDKGIVRTIERVVHWGP
jgi:hypothetical protein